MGLFGKGKKESQSTACDCGGACEAPKEVQTTACDCGGTCESSDGKTSRFIVLGACCKKSTETFENAKKAVAELGYSDQVANIGDNMIIASYGVMQTPAFVIDGKVVSYGKALKVDNIKNLIEKSGIQA